MAGTVTVARIWGIPIRLHWTFLLVLPLFAYLMGQAYFGAEGSATLTDYAWGGALAVALFVSVVAHELGHSWIARRYDVPIESITLLPIGGVAQMERIPEDPRQEMRVALAGPVVSIAIGAPIVVVHTLGLVPVVVPKLDTFVFWLGYLNVFLGAFNLLVPAFPMDGGRVLRAGLAQRLGQRRATEIAAKIGRGLAFAMGLVGLLTLAGGGWLLLLIAFFIYVGASQEESQVRARVTLGDLTAGETMTRDVRTVDPDETVEDVYEDMVETKHLAFPVVRNGRAVGIVGLADLGTVPPDQHATTRVADVMETEVRSIRPDALARDLLQELSRGQEDRLVVVEEDDRLVGVVSRTDLIRLIRILDSEGGSGGGPLPFDRS